MKLSYYPGCSLKSDYQNFEKTAIAVFKKFDIDLIELPRWNCCGTVFSLASDNLMNYLAPTRILIRAQEQNRNLNLENYLVTVCTMCYNTLKQTNYVLTSNEDGAEKLATINSFMDEEEDYQGNIEVKHYLEILRDCIGIEKIKAKVEKPLKGLKIAAYYGCLLLRPKSAALDDPEKPHLLSDLIRATGADVVDFPLFNECCGAYNTVTNPKLVAERTYQILSAARDSGAEAIVTSCPLCFYNLDYRQKMVSEVYPTFEKMPVLFLTQLLAISLGYDVSLCNFKKHFVDPSGLFNGRRNENEK
ncbi:MAG: CoB--CoM heterodisulfide reductase iron-sulfur subunit B family protein [Candidatus Asgardarchaeia archaeon]